MGWHDRQGARSRADTTGCYTVKEPPGGELIRECMRVTTANHKQNCTCGECTFLKNGKWNGTSWLTEDPVQLRKNVRNAAMQSDAKDIRHGTANGYTNFKCRCERCRAWKSGYTQAHDDRRYSVSSVEDIGNAIISTSAFRTTAGRDIMLDEPIKARVITREPTVRHSVEKMPFERRSFDPETVRNRAAGAV